MTPATGEQETLTRYLLRRLPGEEAERLTERLLTPDDDGAELALRMEAVERDLFDAYAHGTLSAEDRAGVDACLLTSAPQREKLRFAYALAARAHSRPLYLSRAIWLAAAAMLLLSLGTAALYFQNRVLRTQVEVARNLARPLPPRPDRSTQVSFLLDPLRRGAGPAPLRLEGAALVRLDFLLGSAATGVAAVRISRQSGALLLEQHSAAVRVSEGPAYVSVWLPSAVLAAGVYSAAVTRDGAAALDYSFRVTTR